LAGKTRDVNRFDYFTGGLDGGGRVSNGGAIFIQYFSIGYGDDRRVKQ